MKRLFAWLVATLMSVGATFGQKALDEESLSLVKELCQRGFYRADCQWVADDERLNDYLGMLGDFSTESMNDTRESIARDKERAQRILNVRKAIVGKNKKVAKQDKELARHFPDVALVRKIFSEAEAVVARCDKLEKVLKSAAPAADSRRSMPKGQLQIFESSSSNGFAGRRSDVKLWRDKEGKGWLSVNRSFYNREAKAIEVGDSVFQYVRDMVERRKLYTVGRHYMPDYEIMDASSWSLYVKFEGGDISSSGYASGPSRSLGLGDIESYLMGIYRQKVPQKEDSEERFMPR